MTYYDRNNIRVRDTIPQDVEYLKSRLRQSDIEEVWASHHHTPEEALTLSYRESVLCFTIQVKDTPIAMFGIVAETILGNRATVWLLASDDMKKIQHRFLRYSKAFIQKMLSFYSLLYNFVDMRNLDSRRWLKWCGAEMGQVCAYGIEKQAFQYFQFRR